MRCFRLLVAVSLFLLIAILINAVVVRTAEAQNAKGKRAAATASLTFPPKLPGGELVVTDSSPNFLIPPETLGKDVALAQTPPTIDFLYYPGQNYEGKPWSNWGDSVAAGGKYYSAIGDHLAVGRKVGDGNHGTGTGLVFEYDPQTKKLRELVNTSSVLKLPAGHYTPGKIHSRLDMGSDGNLYFATHRGSPAAANDANHYQGDWIFRCDPKTGKTEIVVHGPVPKHSIPNSVLDPERLIFYGGTAAGPDSPEQDVWFFAYDCKHNKLLYSGPRGPKRYMMFAKSTGRLYYVPGHEDSPLMRYDPQVGGAPVEIPGSIGIRAATQETPQGLIYTVSLGRGGNDPELWSFNTKTEKIEKFGTAAIGSQGYIASLDVDPTGRYLYYIPGAHGSADRDNTPVVQFDLKTKQKKVIAFLEPFYQKKYGLTLKGTYGSALDPAGDKLYITFNVNRGGKAWDCCGLAVIHIPASERQP